MNWTDYRLTDKGLDRLYGYQISRSQLAPDEYHALFAVDGGGYLYDFEGAKLAKTISHFTHTLKKLTTKGLIEKSPTTTTDILSTLPKSSHFYKILSVYTRVATEKPVSTEEIDETLSLITQLPKLAHLSPEINNARTRHDKVIVLDKAIHLIHDAGPIIIEPEYQIHGVHTKQEQLKRFRWRSETLRLLGKLAGE